MAKRIEVEKHQYNISVSSKLLTVLKESDVNRFRNTACYVDLSAKTLRLRNGLQNGGLCESVRLHVFQRLINFDIQTQFAGTSFGKRGVSFSFNSQSSIAFQWIGLSKIHVLLISKADFLFNKSFCNEKGNSTQRLFWSPRLGAFFAISSDDTPSLEILNKFVL